MVVIIEQVQRARKPIEYSKNLVRICARPSGIMDEQGPLHLDGAMKRGQTLLIQNIPFKKILF